MLTVGPVGFVTVIVPPELVTVETPPAPEPLIVAYGLLMLPVTVTPFMPTAFRTSAPFRELLTKWRNRAGSHVAGISRMSAPLIPGLVFKLIAMLPLTLLYFSRHRDCERRRCVRYTKLQHQTIILP